MSSDRIDAKDCPSCHVCGADGHYRYQNLKDGLFGTFGEWNIKQCSNSNCGLLWLDPMPLPDEIGKAYRSYYTHLDQNLPKRSSFMSDLVGRARSGYFASRYGFGRDNSQLIDRALGSIIGSVPPFAEILTRGWDSLATLPKGRLLEVGCGSGDSLKLMIDWGWQAEGLDPDPGAVRHTASKGLHVHLGSIFEQKYTDNAFDAIIASHVIEHVPDPRALLRECLRILRPGGRLVFLTPNGGSWLHEKFGRYWRDLDPPRHLYLFNAHSLLNLAKQSGFTNCEVSTSSYGAGGIFDMSRALRDRGEYKRKTRNPIEEIASEVVHLCEWLRLSWRPMSGESLKLETCK